MSHSWCKVHAGPNHRLLPYFQQLFSPTWPKTHFPLFLEYTRAVMNKSHVFSLYLHSQITEARSRSLSMHRSPFPWEGDSPGCPGFAASNDGAQSHTREKDPPALQPRVPVTCPQVQQEPLQGTGPQQLHHPHITRMVVASRCPSWSPGVTTRALFPWSSL